MRAHGTASCYVGGCRCELCRVAASTRVKEYRKRPGVVEAERLRNARRRHEKPSAMRAARFWREYGITIAEFDAMLVAQGSACALCRTTEFGKGKNAICLDHDHATGKLRAILCRLCNIGLGAFRDSPDLMHAAATYVERHRDRTASVTVDEHSVTVDEHW